MEPGVEVEGCEARSLAADRTAAMMGTVPDNGIFPLGWKGKQGKILTVLHLGLFFLTLLGGGRGEAVSLEDTVSRSPREAAP